MTRRRARRLKAWVAYRRRYDRLVAHQLLTSTFQHPVRTNPGVFRAQGWDTGARSVLRHGA